MNNTLFDMDTLLHCERIVSHFQPLVSIKKRALLGYEALSRGCNEAGEACISPARLFAAPRSMEEKLQLDRLCRDKALQAFRPLHVRHKDLLLSLNLDIALLDAKSAGSSHLISQAARWGIHPNNIIIELIESDVQNTEALLDFLHRYRKAGFLLALDDVGAGHSNMERIALIKPDVIKIDRTLIQGIHNEFYKFEVTRSLVGLGRRIGAMVLAEGIECREEALTLLELGVDVFQGFYFARPAVLNGHPLQAMAMVEDIAATFKQHTLQGIARRKQRHAAYDAVLQELICSLVAVEQASYDRILAGFMTAHPDIECLYVLDRQGIQISETICNPMNISENKRFIYHPAQRGTDHSLKDYFLPLDAGLPKFTTEPYISRASGNVCTTLAASFHGKDGCGRIVCIDIHIQES